MEDIPLDVKEAILSHLDLKELLSFRLVSRGWNEIICSNSNLKDLHPPIGFNSNSEKRGKGALQFDELMKNRIQESIPFSRFSVSLTEKLPKFWAFSHARPQSWESDILFFGEKYGRHVKHLKIFISENIEGEELVSKTQIMESLLNSSPNIQSVEFNPALPLISSFKISTRLASLKEITGYFLEIPPTTAQASVLNGLLGVAPNLQKIRVSKYEHAFANGNASSRNNRLTVAMTLSLLQKIRHVTTIKLGTIAISPNTESMELLRGLMQLPLAVQELSVLVMYERNARLQEMLHLTNEFVSSISSTLKVLTLRNYVYYDDLPRFKLPQLDNLEKISTENLDWLSIQPLQVPKLVGLSLEKANTADLEYILTTLTSLKHLRLNFETFGESFLPTLSGMEVIPRVSNNWMTGSLDRVEAPLGNPLVPSMANMTKLVTLSLTTREHNSTVSLRVLIGITYLSSTKKIRRLELIVLSLEVLSWNLRKGWYSACFPGFGNAIKRWTWDGNALDYSFND